METFKTPGNIIIAVDEEIASLLSKIEGKPTAYQMHTVILDVSKTIAEAFTNAGGEQSAYSKRLLHADKIIEILAAFNRKNK